MKGQLRIMKGEVHEKRGFMIEIWEDIWYDKNARTRGRLGNCKLGYGIEIESGRPAVGRASAFLLFVWLPALANVHPFLAVGILLQFGNGQLNGTVGAAAGGEHSGKSPKRLV